MLPGVVLGWSHRKRESNQTPERALQIGRNVADGSRVTRFGITPSRTILRQRPVSSLHFNLNTISRLRCERQIIDPISKKSMVSLGFICPLLQPILPQKLNAPEARRLHK